MPPKISLLSNLIRRDAGRNRRPIGTGGVVTRVFLIRVGQQSTTVTSWTWPPLGNSSCRHRVDRAVRPCPFHVAPLDRQRLDVRVLSCSRTTAVGGGSGGTTPCAMPSRASPYPCRMQLCLLAPRRFTPPGTDIVSSVDTFPVERIRRRLRPFCVLEWPDKSRRDHWLDRLPSLGTRARRKTRFGPSEPRRVPNRPPCAAPRPPLELCT